MERRVCARGKRMDEEKHNARSAVLSYIDTFTALPAVGGLPRCRCAAVFSHTVAHLLRACRRRRRRRPRHFLCVLLLEQVPSYVML